MLFRFAEGTLVLSAFRYVAATGDSTLIRILYWTLFVAFLAPFVIAWSRLAAGRPEGLHPLLRVIEVVAGVAMIAAMAHLVVALVVEALLRLYP